MFQYGLVVLGSAGGGILRFLASGIVASRFGQSCLWGTLFVNGTGSFFTGLFSTLTAPAGRRLAGPGGRNFFMTGFWGGDTTFSSFSLQTLYIAQDDGWFYAGGNAGPNPALCLMATPPDPAAD